MKKTILLSMIFFAALSLNASGFTSLYSEQRDFSVGEIITVLVVENASASSSAKEETDRSYNHNFSTEAGKGPFDFISLSSFGLGGKNKTKGDAKTSRQGKLTATVTVKITEIEPDGNLRIEGEKSVFINGEEEVTKIKGLVRPKDISEQNTIYSYNVADARISYKGAGAVNTGSRTGYISRVINWLF